MIKRFFSCFFLFGAMLFYPVLAKDTDGGTLKVVVREGVLPYEFKKIKNKIHISQKRKKVQIITPQGNGGELPLSLGVKADLDLNEDGYLDLIVTEESGVGLNVNSIFLYSPEHKQFQKLSGLSYLPNLSYNSEKKEFEESQNTGEGYIFYLRRYKLQDGKPVLTKEIKQDSLESENYYLRVVREKEDEKLALRCEALMKKEPQFDLAYLISGDCDSCELQYSGVKACERGAEKKVGKKGKKKIKKK